MTGRAKFPTARDLSEVIEGIPDLPGRQYIRIGISRDGRFDVLGVGNNYYHAGGGGRLEIEGMVCTEGGPFDLVLPCGVGLLGPEAAKNWPLISAIYECYLRRIDAFLKALPDQRWWLGWMEVRFRLSS